MNSVLIVQLGLFGDCLFATPIPKIIKNEYPDCKVSWAIWNKYASVLDNNPEVDEVIAVDLDGQKYNSKETIRRVLLNLDEGQFDKIIISQIPDFNWHKFNGTIRSTILSSYPIPNKADVRPRVFNTEEEKLNVENFATRHKLHEYEHIILCECAPGSGQSRMNFDYAMELSNYILSLHINTAIILSSPNSFESINENIIDGSTLSFRENLALTHYCTLLIGCSSGISWLATSVNAKRLKMLQLLSFSYPIYAGMLSEGKIWGLKTDNIIEISDTETVEIKDALTNIFLVGFDKVKEKSRTAFKPELRSFQYVFRYLFTKFRWSDLPSFTRTFYLANKQIYTRVQLAKIIMLEFIRAPKTLYERLTIK